MIKIGDQQFETLRHGTLEHDHWLMSKIREQGLAELALGADEKPEQFVDRILVELIGSGKIFPIMGGLLLPSGTKPEDWTPEMALATGDYLRKRTQPEDKAIIRQAAIEILVGFFSKGLSHLVTSPGFSRSLESQGEPGHDTLATTSPTAASTSASGDHSSGIWQGMTRRARSLFSRHGRYATHS